MAGIAVKPIRACDEIVAGYFKSYDVAVLRFCRHLVGDPDIASELSQETFLRALESLRQTPRRQENPLAWLLTIARNLCTDHLRRIHLRVSVVPTEDVGELRVKDTGNSDPTFDAMEARQRAARIRPQLARALRSLRPIERRVFLDHEEEGWSFDALARRDATTADALRNIAFRARKQLRMCLPRDLLTLVGLGWLKARATASRLSERLAVEGSMVALSQIAAAILAIGVGGLTPAPRAPDGSNPARLPAIVAEAASPLVRSPASPFDEPARPGKRAGVGADPVAISFEHTKRRDHAAAPQHTQMRVEVRKPDGSTLVWNQTHADCFGHPSSPLPEPSPVWTSC